MKNRNRKSKIEKAPVGRAAENMGKLKIHPPAPGFLFVPRLKYKGFSGAIYAQLRHIGYSSHLSFDVE